MVVHTRERPETCEFCGRTFSQRATLNKHMRSFHPPGARPQVSPWPRAEEGPEQAEQAEHAGETGDAEDVDNRL